MTKSHTNQQRSNLNVLSPPLSGSTRIGSENFDERHSADPYLTFNILGKLFHVKQSLFDGTSSTEVDHLKQFYDRDRQQYVIDISPFVFQSILHYYTTQELYEPASVQFDYFREILKMFHIDASSLDSDTRYERVIPRQSIFQLLHVLLEYPDSCRFAQILHYICSMIALLSCLLVSLSLTSRDPTLDLHTWNTTEMSLPVHSKSSIAHFQHRSSKVFLVDTLCLVWAVGETILRTLSTPHLYDYFTTLGLFDILGVVFHFIYIYMIGSGTRPSRCRSNPIRAVHLHGCIAFNRRLMILNLFRKIRLVRYIRPVKHLVLSLIASKKEVLRLVVLISFIIAILAPLIFIIESSHIHECPSLTQTPVTYCIQTVSDACYYLVLIISTVGYGDIYPKSHLARLVAMLASPLSIMMLSVPLSSIYSRYIAQQEIYQMQLNMPENVRYFIDDSAEFIEEDEKFHKMETIDATEQINESLKRFGISRQLQEELHRRQLLGELSQQ